MTTKQCRRDEQKLQELAAQVEALRTPETAPYVEQTLQRIREWTEGQLRARFTQIRDATLEAALRGNPKYREINMSIVAAYDCVVAFLSGRGLRLHAYANKVTGKTELVYRGKTSDGRTLCTLEIAIEANRNIEEGDLFSPDYWAMASIDNDNCWIMAICELCGDEFRPTDGYYEDGHEPTYSYCAECCHW